MKKMNTKKPKKTGVLALSAFVLTLALSACGGGESTEDTSASDDSLESTDPVAAFFADSAIPESQSLGKVLKTAKPGETVRVSGQIGGTEKPFGEGFAIFMLADESLTFCNEMAEPDHCPTPWDACCEDPQKIQENRTVVQFSNAAGEVIPVNLKGRHGLEELTRITVEGTLVQREQDGSLLIEGKRIYAPQTASLE